MATILVIDDDPNFLSNIALLLEFEGFTVIVSLNGAEALESIRQRPVDLILCDMLMSPMSGFEILQALQQNPETASIPFIFTTGVHWEGVEIMGATGYLQKPFSNDALLELIREQLPA